MTTRRKGESTTNRARATRTILVGLATLYLSAQLVYSNPKYFLLDSSILRFDGAVQESMLTSDSFAPVIFGNDGFPRWDESSGGIEFSPIQDYLSMLLNGTISARGSNNCANTPYVIDSNRTLWVSQRIRREHPKGEKYFGIQPPELIASLALQLLDAKMSQNDATARNRWSALNKAINMGGLPFLAHLGDFELGCNKDNFSNNKSVPIFTTNAAVTCRHAIPWPSFYAIRGAARTSYDWTNRIMPKYNETYPWKDKIPKVVWRGALSGPIEGDENSTQYSYSEYPNPRWRACLVANNPATIKDPTFHNGNSTPTAGDQSLFDIRLVTVRKRYRNWDFTSIGGLGSSMKMDDFQQYRAILDIDGASWSSRFEKLLCYNSVVVKMEPKWVDYFHFSLEPWVHYIPVRDDLSDLIPNVKWAMADENEEAVKTIIQNANAWCAENYTYSKIALDVLDLWNTYAGWLEIGAPDWNSDWRSQWDEILANARNEMVPVNLNLISELV